MKAQLIALTLVLLVSGLTCAQQAVEVSALHRGLKTLSGKSPSLEMVKSIHMGCESRSTSVQP